MPARRLDDTALAVGKSDVIGQDSDSVEQFIRHAGLSAETHLAVTTAVALRLTDMGPPLALAGEAESGHTHGTVPLTGDEIAQIDLFIDRVAAEYQANRAGQRQQYVVLPHCLGVAA